MAEMLAGSGIEVTVIVADERVDDHSVAAPRENLAVARFNPARRGAPQELGGTAGLSYAFFKVVELLIAESGAPDVIESQDYLGIAYYLQQFKLCGYAPYSDIPVVITIHAPAFVYLPYNEAPIYRFPDFWTGVIEKESIRAADLVISPSAFMAEEVGRHLDYQGRLPVILPYGYRACGSVEAVAAPIERNKIVYYGKLSPQKGSFELLRYFSALWDEGFPHALHVIGGTDIVYQPEQQTMGQIFRQRYGEYMQRGLLRLHGKIDPASLPAELADAHVVLLPSIVDNLPYVCLETMACGKIVLASVQGGQREIITDGEDGFLFDHRDPESFAQKLKHILSLSDEEVLRLQKNARGAMWRYDYAVIAP
ncbi:MAG TPA: glycosyltransferase family 4 protein, partial [Puia sp.]|nr:glycosyltransferase family 4 protein [Puia sp.]